MLCQEPWYDLPWPLVGPGDTGSAVSFSEVVLFFIESLLPFLLGECLRAEKQIKKQNCK